MRRKIFYTDKQGNSFIKDADGKYAVMNPDKKFVSPSEFAKFMRRPATKKYLLKEHGLEFKQVKRK